MASGPAGSSNNQLFKSLKALAASALSAPIANASLASMLAGTFKGRKTSSGAGVPEDLTATEATAELNTFTSALKGLVPNSGGGTTNFLRADGSFAVPPTTIPAGAIIQVLQAVNTAGTSIGNTPIPYDDTTPLSTEGTSILSQAITPGASANKVKVTVDVMATYDSATTFGYTIAVFRGTTCIDVHFSTGWGERLVFLDSPGTTSSTTYSVRIGAEAAGSGLVRINGDVLSRRFGGAAACTLTLEEVKG